MSISPVAYRKLRQSGLLAIDSEIFGHRYGTMFEDIRAAVEDPSLVVVEWSVYNIDVLERAAGREIESVYLYPAHTGDLRLRLHARDGSNPLSGRVIEAEREIWHFLNGELDVNRTRRQVKVHHDQIALTYHNLMAALDQIRTQEG